MARCKWCGLMVELLDKAPEWAVVTDDGQGWADDHCGDVVEDFICPRRDSTGRYPDGKPHEVADEPEAAPVVDDVTRMYRVADDYEASTLDALRNRAGITWECESCEPGGWTNLAASATCDRCGTPRADR